MNANYQSQMPTIIKDWLDSSSNQLSLIGIPSARLDSEVILAYSLGKDRTFLHAHPDQNIDPNQLETANNYLELRLKRIPIAYIIGYKEFYGRQFLVNESTLIPRPESEEIINILKKIITEKQLKDIKLVDVGTGSGCLGITAKLEFPTINVTLIDISPDALKVAESNAKKLSANVDIIQSDLLKNYAEKPDIIIANLPYVDRDWERSPETDFEPSIALFADNNGMAIIKKLINQSASLLTGVGYLILESDPEQHIPLIEYAKKHSFNLAYQSDYIIAFKR